MSALIDWHCGGLAYWLAGGGVFGALCAVAVPVSRWIDKKEW